MRGRHTDRTLPLAVVLCPKPDQSSITVTPGASRGTMARSTSPASVRATTGMKCAKSAPVQ
jgi:hypothetical protein